MREVVEFMRACGAFFVLTVQENAPAGRPFGAVIEDGGKLYIATGASKEVCRQLRARGEMQIVALKPGTRQWMRISGHATECSEQRIKEKLFEECPVLTKRYAGVGDPNFIVFSIAVSAVEQYE